jgi:hypothetical protein
MRHALRCRARLRSVGRGAPSIAALPSADALSVAAQHPATDKALATGITIAVANGVHFFRSQTEAGRQRFAALLCVVASVDSGRR